MRRQLYDETHDLFRDSFRTFVERHLLPHHAEWEQAGIVAKSLFRKAGNSGFLGIAAPTEHGGGGDPDFRFNAIMIEELGLAGVSAAGTCLTLHNDVCMPYFTSETNDDQKSRWLPGICSGELMTAIAMTEPGIGSDLASMRTTARRVGDEYIINGAKMFISNGINCDLVIVAAKTDPLQRHKGISLLVVESPMHGFRRGRNLEKIGQHSADTAELFFDDVRVPANNLLGAEGSGFLQLVSKLPQERLSVAVGAVAQADTILTETLGYCRTRTAFGQPIGSFQHNRFVLAEIRTEVDIAQVFVDRQIEALNSRELTAEDAAMSKWWCTELLKRTADACLQLHGGYGYMEEYPIARAWRDARVQTIYGGTTEIMKEIIGRSMGL